MAKQAKIVITVTSARGHSTVRYATKGTYVSFVTAGLADDLTNQPIQPTASLAGFWLSVLDLVTADITAQETP